jgi:hypothetical protein
MQSSKIIASVIEIADKLNLDREVVEEYDVDTVLKACDEDDLDNFERMIEVM